MSVKVDITIVGGGMVGLAMAAALADTGLKIAVVEKSDMALLKQQGWLASADSETDYDIRVSAINPGNRELLQTFGAWQKIPQQRQADFEKMKVWDGEGSGQISFDAAELATQRLGTIVENQVLRAALFDTLEAQGNVRFIQSDAIEAIIPEPEKVHLQFNDGNAITSRLLIGADGAFSSVRQKLRITSLNNEYQQRAFVANVVTELPHEATAWQRFVRTGPVAFLPLRGSNLCSVVWTLDDHKAEAVQQMDAAAFEQALASAFEHRLGNIKLASEFRSFPLVARHSESYLAPRCVLIGDAAHSIHPLAGQGVNLGFQDVDCLSRIIKRQLQKSRDFGLEANLRPFERERKAENSLMLHSMTGFKWLFGQSNLPATLLRNWGMNAVAASGPIKDAIIRHAMGI